MAAVHSSWGTPVVQRPIQEIVQKGLLCALLATVTAVGMPTRETLAVSPNFAFPGTSSAQRDQVLANLPMSRLNARTQSQIMAIAKSPTIYRRLPTQAIDCDRDMFLFLARRPEVLVGIWDLMGLTNVVAKRTGPYQLDAEDGSGTRCQIDLVYGDPNLHIFIAHGSYDGRLTPRALHGSGVFVLRSTYATTAIGETTVTGSIDCFVQLDSLGVDLVARSLSGLIGKSADTNFTETAKFVSQVSQASRKDPASMIDIAQRLPQVQPPIKREFADVISTVGRRSIEAERTAQRVLRRTK